MQAGKNPKFDDLDVFLGPDFLITVHAAECEVLSKVCQRAQQNAVRRLDQILYAIVDLIVDEYLSLLDKICRRHIAR